MGRILSLMLWLCALALGRAARNSRPGRHFLIVTTDMRDAWVPGNVRVRDLALTLVAQEEPASVVLMTQHGDFAPTLRRPLEEAGVELIAPTAQENSGIFAETVLQSRSFDVAFLYLWFWGTEVSVPHAYLPVLRFYQPHAQVIIVTDDAHTERLKRLESINSQLSEPVGLFDAIGNELEIYAQADAVMTVTESDQRILTEALKQAGMEHVPVKTVHWTHEVLTSSRQAFSLSEDVQFDQRSGLVFVGFGRNPSNRIGLAWFFEKVWPLVDSEMAGVPIYLVGSGHQMPRQAGANANIVRKDRQDGDQLRRLLRSARVMIAPVFSTGLATKVLMGMGAGLPVVTTTEAAAGYHWSTDSSGSNQAKDVVVPHAMSAVDSPQAFARAIMQVYRDPTEWQRLSRQGQALAMSQLMSDRFQHDLHALLEGMEKQPKTFHAPVVGSAFIPVRSFHTHELSLKRRAHSAENVPLGTGGLGTGGWSDSSSTGLGSTGASFVESSSGAYYFGNAHRAACFSWSTLWASLFLLVAFTKCM